MPYDVLCAGLIVANLPIRPVDESIFSRDVTQVERIDLLPGGDAVNQSIVLSRLGLKTALLGRRGPDAIGGQMLAMVEKEGVDISHITDDPELNTSTCIMLIRKDGRRTFCTYKGATGRFCFEDIDLSLLDKARIVSIGSLMALPAFDQKGAAQLFKEAKKRGCVTIADTKYDTYGIGLAGIEGLLADTDYFMPSFEEASYLTGTENPAEMAAVFMGKGAKNVVIKLGEKGCYVRSKDEEFTLPAYMEEAVDTTGAGDNFVSGFIRGLSLGFALKDCANLALLTGALCVTEVGPATAVKSMEQVRAYALKRGATLPA